MFLKMNRNIYCGKVSYFVFFYRITITSRSMWQLPSLDYIPIQVVHRTINDHLLSKSCLRSSFQVLIEIHRRSSCACITARSEAAITNLSGAKTTRAPIGKQLKSEIVDRTIFGLLFNLAAAISDSPLPRKHHSFYTVCWKKPSVAFD